MSAPVTGDHSASAEHAHPTTRTYIVVFGVLFVVTAAEVVAAQLLPIMGLASLVAPTLIIMAILKGALIMMYYMHLKSDSIAFTAPFAFGLVIATGLIISMIGLYIVSPRIHCEPELGKGCVITKS